MESNDLGSTLIRAKDEMLMVYVPEGSFRMGSDSGSDDEKPAHNVMLNANQSIPDEDVLIFAIQERRALLTINRRDFIPFHEKGIKQSGIIVCTQDGDVAGQATRIHASIQSMDDISGQLIRINRPQREKIDSKILRQ